ncbi:MAG: DUF4404 family protein, partial [Oceanobacter sp.]
MSDDLKARLQALHEELARTPTLDEQTQQALNQIAVDIEQMSPADPEALAETLNTQAVVLEQEHPTLAAVVKGLVDGLAR